MTVGDATREGIGSAQRLTGSIRVRFASAIKAVRGRHLVVLDLASIALSIYLALSLRLDTLLTYDGSAVFLPIALLPLLVRPLVNETFGLYRRAWATPAFRT